MLKRKPVNTFGKKFVSTENNPHAIKGANLKRKGYKTDTTSL